MCVSFLARLPVKPLNFKFCFTAWLQNPVACFQFHPGMATSPNDTVDRESIDNIIYTCADDIHGLCRSLIILQTYGDDFPICLLANIGYNLTPTNVPLCFYVPRSHNEQDFWSSSVLVREFVQFCRTFFLPVTWCMICRCKERLVYSSTDATCFEKRALSALIAEQPVCLGTKSKHDYTMVLWMGIQPYTV